MAINDYTGAQVTGQQVPPADISPYNKNMCPNCGYCPHCGRSGYRAVPYNPYPWYPSWPTYTYGPIWMGGTAGGNTFSNR